MARKTIDLKDFKGINIRVNKEKLTTAIHNSANKLVDNLKVLSPTSNRKRAYKYFETWNAEEYEKMFKATIWNKRNYRLTHLLENGHLQVNKKSGVGWVAPRPHIKPAFESAKPYIVEQMKKACKKLDANFK